MRHAVLPVPGLQEGPRCPRPCPATPEHPEASGSAQRRRHRPGPAVTFAIQSISWVLLSSPPCPTFLAGSPRSRRSWRLRAQQDGAPGPLRAAPQAEAWPAPCIPAPSRGRMGHRDPALRPPPLPGLSPGGTRPHHARTGLSPCGGRAGVDALPGVPASGPPACARGGLGVPAGVPRGEREADGASLEPHSRGGGAHFAAAAAHPVPLSLNQFGGLLKRRVSAWRLIASDPRSHGPLPHRSYAVPAPGGSAVARGHRAPTAGQGLLGQGGSSAQRRGAPGGGSIPIPGSGGHVPVPPAPEKPPSPRQGRGRRWGRGAHARPHPSPRSPSPRPPPCRAGRQPPAPPAQPAPGWTPRTLRGLGRRIPKGTRED